MVVFVYIVKGFQNVRETIQMRKHKRNQKVLSKMADTICNVHITWIHFSLRCMEITLQCFRCFSLLNFIILVLLIFVRCFVF